MRPNENKLTEHSEQKTFQSSQLFLIVMINLVLLTVDLTVFNICFLLIFMTSVLKFYRTYVIEKHIDMIEISPISTQPKTSITVHLFSIAFRDILLNKSLARSLIHIGFAIGGYFVMKLVPFYVLLIIIVDVQYLYAVWKRHEINAQKINEPLNASKSGHQKPNKSPNEQSKIQPSTSFMYLSSSLKPTSSTFTSKFSQKSQNSSSNLQSPKSPSSTHQMNMIEQVEQDKIFDQDLPLISNIRLTSSQSLIDQN